MFQVETGKIAKKVSNGSQTLRACGVKRGEAGEKDRKNPAMAV